MSNAREQIALRNTLGSHLPYHELRDIHWPTVLTAATPAIERGWTGDELARWCIGDLSENVDNVGALIVATLRQLGQQDPPRDTTPTPVNVSEIRAQRAAAASASRNVDHAAWVRHIKAQIHT